MGIFAYPLKMDHFKIFYSSEHVVKMLFWGVDNAAPYQSNSHWNILFRGLMQKYPNSDPLLARYSGLAIFGDAPVKVIIAYCPHAQTFPLLRVIGKVQPVLFSRNRRGEGLEISTLIFLNLHINGRDHVSLQAGDTPIIHHPRTTGKP